MDRGAVSGSKATPLISPLPDKPRFASLQHLILLDQDMVRIHGISCSFNLMTKNKGAVEALA